MIKFCHDLKLPETFCRWYFIILLQGMDESIKLIGGLSYGHI